MAQPGIGTGAGSAAAVWTAATESLAAETVAGVTARTTATWSRMD